MKAARCRPNRPSARAGLPARRGLVRAAGSRTAQDEGRNSCARGFARARRLGARGRRGSPVRRRSRKVRGRPLGRAAPEHGRRILAPANPVERVQALRVPSGGPRALPGFLLAPGGAAGLIPCRSQQKDALLLGPTSSLASISPHSNAQQHYRGVLPKTGASTLQFDLLMAGQNALSVVGSSGGRALHSRLLARDSRAPLTTPAPSSERETPNGGDRQARRTQDREHHPRVAGRATGVYAAGGTLASSSRMRLSARSTCAGTASRSRRTPASTSASPIA